MTKIAVSKFFWIISALAGVLALSTCTIGLGNQVDTKPPVVAITAPEASAYCKDSIVISGTAADETSLKSVRITLRNLDGSGEYGFPATLNASKTAWSVTVSTLGADNAHLISDGVYECTAYATDNANRTSMATRQFNVDNTAPTVLATSPLTYRADNQPVFFKTIDVKGEVYDKFPLDRVEVRICKSDGTEIFNTDGVTAVSETADGTNTFAARFDWSADMAACPLSDNTTYYYSITAYDEAGNSNTYFYHRFDIYPLLTANADGFVTFPSMNAIGKLDQLVDVTEPTSGLTKAALDGIRLGFDATASQKYPDFLFMTTPGAKIQWLNIPSPTVDDISVIGIGVPIVGTILPPSDGSSIEKSSIACTISKYNADTKQFENPVTQTGITKTAVGSSLNFEIAPVGSDGSSLKTGNYQVHLTYSTNSKMAGESYQLFNVSAGAPVLKETAVGGAESPVLVQKMVSAETVMGGTAMASNGDASADELYYNLDGGANVNIPLGAGGSWTLAVPAPADHSNDGTHTYVLTAVSGGLSSSISRMFVVDTRAPVLNIQSPANNSWMNGAGGSIDISGTAADTWTDLGVTKNGSGIDSVYYTVDVASADHSADTNQTTAWTKATGTITWSGSVDISAMTIGAKKLWVYAIDAAGNPAVSSASFGLDNENPVPTVSSPATAYYTTNAFSISGTASDDNAVASVSVSVNAGTLQALTLGAGNAWTYTAPALADGSYTLVFTAKDIAGKSSSTTRTFRVDTTPPEIALSNLADGDSIDTASYTIKGTTSDDNGLASIGYSLDSGTSWNPITVASTWSCPVTGLTEGTANNVRFRATDKAGNTTYLPAGGASDISFGLDLYNPRATIAAPAGTGLYQSKSDVAFSGVADDDAANPSDGSVRQATSATLSYSKDGGPAVTVAAGTGANEFNWNAAAGTWAWTMPASLADGQYVVTLSVTDSAGKTASATRNIQIDTTAPELSVTAPAANEASSTTAYTIKGSARDSGGVGFDGTDDVQYSFDNSTWTTFTGAEWDGYNWTKAVTLPAGEGTKTLYVRSSDKLGNLATSSVNFYYDVAAPTFDETTVNTIDTQYTNANLTFGGTVSDSNATARPVISLAVNGTSVGTILYTYGSPWSYTFDTAARAEGTYTLAFTATDAAGKTTSLTRTVSIDKTAPTVTLSTNLTAWQRTTSVAVSGTAADAGGTVKSGVAKVQYSLNGTTWSDLNGTTGWSGSITFAESASNTLFLKSIDKAGNESAVSGPITVKVDATAPAFAETVANNTAQTKTDMSFSGSISDNLALDGTAPLTVSRKKNGTSLVDASITPTSGNWNYTVSASGDHSNDGVWDLTFTAKDSSGLTTKITKSFTIDTTAPALVIKAPAGNEASDSATYTIKGTASDAGVGFDGTDDVQYSFDNSTWTTFTGAEWDGYNWTKAVTLPAGEGNKTLYARSYDTLGNMATASVSFYYDVAAPTFDETTVNSADSQYRNADLTFGGPVSDSNATSRPVISLAVNGTQTVASIPYTYGSPWSYIFDTDALAEGTYNLVFTATDAAKRTTSVTRKVVVDKTGPTISGVTDVDQKWFTDPARSISGTAIDAGGSGLSLVEYRVSADGGSTWGSWSSMTGTSSFSATVSFADGNDNKLEIRARDKAGNASATSSQTVWIDTMDPSFDITSPVSVPVINGSGSLAITVSASDATSGADSVQAKVGDYDFGSGTVYSATIAGGTATVTATDLSSLAEGNGKIYLRVADKAGRHSVVQAQAVLVDKTAPTVSFGTPAEGATVNKTISLSGTASDANGVQSAALQIFRASDSTWVAAPTGTTTGTTSWACTSFDTTAFANGGVYDTDVTAATKIRLRAAVTDAAGNVGYAERYLVVDQDTDRPVVKLSNVNVDGSTTLKMANTVFGSVSDDDGVTLFEVSEDEATWTTTAFDGGWSYSASAGDGTKTLYFRVTDARGTVFTTGGANAPKVQYDAAVVSSVVSFKVDTLAPELSSANPVVIDRTSAYDFADATAVSANMPLGGGAGGVYSKFALRILATDANGIANVSVAIPGAAGSPFTTTANGTEGVNPTFTRFDTGVIDVSALADGVCTITVTVTDNSGLTSAINRTVLIDNTAPTLTHTTPRHLTDVVNGDVTVKGSAEDGSGSGLAGISYQAGLCADRSAGSPAWIAASGSLYNWEIPFTGSNKIDQYGGIPVTLDTGTDSFTLTSHGYANGTVVYFDGSTLATGMSAATGYYVVNAAADTFQVSATSGGAAVNFSGTPEGLNVSKYSKDENNDGIWELPILVRASDAAGNVFMEDYTTYVVLVDPSGDRPKVSVVYPDPAETNRTMGGTIRLFGTATDDDAVGSVYMQIDVDGDGDYDAVDSTYGGIATDWYAGGLGRAVSGTASWNQTINASGEFNPSGDGTRTIHFRVRAKDIYGTYGAWSANQTIIVDNKLPKIGSSTPLTLTQGATVRTYVSDLWVKGNWALGGSVEDESGIADIQIEGDINGSLSGNPTWFTAASFGATSGYTLAIPVNTAATGSLSFTITATDYSSPPTSNTMTVNINYDNTAPTDNGYAGSLPVTQSNKVYSLSGSVNETGAGFERLAFYFERTPTTPRVYNPMEARTGDANRTNLDGLTMIEGLPCAALSGVTRSDQYSLTSAALVNNKNVRAGGLVSIGGIYRTILTVDYPSGTITWADSVDTGVTTAYAAYAMVVNNTTVETPVWSGDTLLSITNDDGDGMVEAVERSGGLYSWTASIDSRNIPDGPIDIHYVAYDKAGNYVTGTVATTVSNNRPLLAAVTLGTDLDGNGSISAGEQVPAFSALDGSGNRQASATVASSSFIAKDKTSVDIDVVGGNGILDYALAVGASPVTGHTDAVNSPYLRDSEASAVNTITLTAAQLTAIGDTIVSGVAGAAKSLVFTIWDSTEEMTRGTDSQFATLTVPIQIDITDDVKPTAAITPFFWNSASDNSLYGNSKANGHIEITGVVDGTDPDVSGQVSIRGTAYDDQRLSSLWMSIADSVPATRFAFAGSGPTKTVGGRTYYEVAAYNPATGTWTAADQMATNGWKFTVTPVSLTQDGHTVGWQLDWDTSKLTNVAALNNLVRVQAEDKRTTTNPAVTAGGFTAGTWYRIETVGTTNFTSIGALANGVGVIFKATGVGTGTGTATLAAPNASDESSTQTATGALTPYYSMDVVPYISGISNPANQGLTSDVIRSSSGKYSIEYHASNVFNVSGFNLGGTGYLPAARVSAAPITTPSGLAPATTLVTSTSITVAKALTKSGYLTVFVNNVPSVNNLTTTNNQPYQQEEDAGKPYSHMWNDDRYLWVWNTTQVMPAVTTQTFYYPDMMMDPATPTQPIFSYCEDNSGHTRRTTGDTTSVARAGLWYERQTAIAYADGSYWILSAEDAFGGTNIGFLQLNRDVNAGAATGTAGTDFIEIIGEDYGARALNRFRYPKLLAETNGADADIYIAYFDMYSSSITFTAMRATGQDSTAAGFTQATNDNTRCSPVYTLPAATAGAGFSWYYDMVKYDTNSVAIAYYDETLSTLRMAYSTAATTGNNVANTAAWTSIQLDADLYCGSHLSMTNDATYIYVAYYDSANANLKMVRVPIATMVPETPLVIDSYLSVGTWTNIQMMDFDGAGGTYASVPVITYYSDSFNGTKKPIKMAFPTSAANITTNGVTAVNEETFSGTWEVMTVPAASPPRGGMEQFNHTQIASYANNGLTLPVVGWLADRLEYSKLQPMN